MYGIDIEMNYWAILVSAFVFWLLGALWFSVLFKESWQHAQEKLGHKIKKLSAGKMQMKMIRSFLINFVQVWGIAAIISGLDIMTIQPAIFIGLLVGICFTAASMYSKSMWENQSLKLTLMDVGYPILGFVISAMILALWQ